MVLKVTTLKATYKLIEITPEYTIEGASATLEGNILTFNEIGEVTVTATYNGESVSRTYSGNPNNISFNSWEYNKAYVTNLNIGDTFTGEYLTTEVSGWKCGIIPISNVSSVIITGAGGSRPRLYCFVDAGNKVLQVASASYQAYNEWIDVPQGAKYLIVNISKNTAETGSLILLNS